MESLIHKIGTYTLKCILQLLEYNNIIKDENTTLYPIPLLYSVVSYSYNWEFSRGLLYILTPLSLHIL